MLWRLYSKANPGFWFCLLAIHRENTIGTRSCFPGSAFPWGREHQFIWVSASQGKVLSFVFEFAWSYYLKRFQIFDQSWWGGFGNPQHGSLSFLYFPGSTFQGKTIAYPLLAKFLWGYTIAKITALCDRSAHEEAESGPLALLHLGLDSKCS